MNPKRGKRFSKPQTPHRPLVLCWAAFVPLFHTILLDLLLQPRLVIARQPANDLVKFTAQPCPLNAGSGRNPKLSKLCQSCAPMGVLLADGIRGGAVKHELVLIQRVGVLFRAVSTAIFYHGCEETKLGSRCCGKEDANRSKQPGHQEDPLVILAQIGNQFRRMQGIEGLLVDNKLPRFAGGKGRRLFSLLPGYAWVMS